MKNYSKCFLFFVILLSHFSVVQADANGLSLKDNLKRAQTGDYIVTSQSKTYTLLHIVSKNSNLLTIEEVSVPGSQLNLTNFSWADWLRNGAPNHTCWMSYTIDTNSGQMQDSYSYTNNAWYRVKMKDTYLPTLLKLNFTPISERERKKVSSPLSEGGTGGKVTWNPPMIVGGKRIPNVRFDAWRAYWPKDNSELSDKIVEVYLPQESERYPAYFPYWLQVSGVVGSSQMRIIDSGSGLVIPSRGNSPT